MRIIAVVLIMMVALFVTTVYPAAPDSAVVLRDWLKANIVKGKVLKLEDVPAQSHCRFRVSESADPRDRSYIEVDPSGLISTMAHYTPMAKDTIITDTLWTHVTYESEGRKWYIGSFLGETKYRKKSATLPAQDLPLNYHLAHLEPKDWMVHLPERIHTLLTPVIVIRSPLMKYGGKNLP